MSEQKHPQEARDRAIVNTLLSGQPTPENLAELARLRIRYHDFPGARSIQQDLNTVLQNWQLSEAELFAQTRQLHAAKKVYTRADSQTEDWS